MGPANPMNQAKNQGSAEAALQNPHASVLKGLAPGYPGESALSYPP